MGFDLVAQEEIGAEGASGLVELFPEGGQRLGATRGGERGSSRTSSWPGPGWMSPEVARASRMSAYASSRARA